MKYIKSLLLVLVVLVSAFAFTGCGKKEKETGIVGTWKYDKGITAVYVFKADKTGTYTLGIGDQKTVMKLTYTYDEEKLHISYEGYKSPFDLKYELKDDELIIVDSFGEKVSYKRQK